MADPSPGSAVSVQGLRELQRAFARGEKEISKDLRETLRGVAQPVATSAEQLAQQEIRRIGTRWFRMRVGVTRRLVYVAPKERGAKSRARRSYRRPLFGDKLMSEAMGPALERHEENILGSVREGLDDFARRWEHSG